MTAFPSCTGLFHPVRLLFFHPFSNLYEANDSNFHKGGKKWISMDNGRIFENWNKQCSNLFFLFTSCSCSTSAGCRPCNAVHKLSYLVEASLCFELVAQNWKSKFWKSITDLPPNWSAFVYCIHHKIFKGNITVFCYCILTMSEFYWKTEKGNVRKTIR